MDDLRPHPDPLEVLRTVLMEEVLPDLEGFPSVTVGEWPEQDLSRDLPYVSLDLEFGVADFIEQSASVAVDVFAARRSDAILLSGLIMVRLLDYPGGVLLQDGGWAKVDDVVCTAIPRSLPWDDTAIRRQSATYEFSVRR